MSGDAYHITSGRDDGEGALLAMNGAFRCLLNPHKQNETEKPYELWCVNAHATSTPKGDAAEMRAVNIFLEKLHNSPLSNIVKTNQEGVYVTSHKGNFGHLMGAAGAIESAFVALSLVQKILPPTINLGKPDDGMELKERTKIVRDVVDGIKGKRELSSIEISQRKISAPLPFNFYPPGSQKSPNPHCDKG